MSIPFAPAISSRENALIKQLHKLAHDGAAYRKLGQIWLEGEHLVSSVHGSPRNIEGDGMSLKPDCLAHG